MISGSIPAEADVVPRLIRRLPLACECENWAEAVIAAGNSERLSPDEALAMVDASEFQIDRSLEALYRVYCT